MKDSIPQQTGKDSAVSTSPVHPAGADPRGAQGLLLEAQARAGQGALDEAITLLRQALSIAPGFGSAWFGIAEMERIRGNLTEAERCYLSAVELLPADAVAPYNYAVMLESAGRIAEAREAYTKSLDRDPRFARALANLGNLDFLAGDLTTAAGRCLKAVETDPSLPEPFYTLGLIANKRGDLVRAEACFRRVIALRGEQAGGDEAHNSLGSVLFRRHRYAEAIACFRQALQARGGNYPEATDNLIAALMALRRFSEMSELLAERLIAEPDNANLLIEAAFCHLNQCRWNQLNTLLERLSTLPERSLANRAGPFLSLAFPGISRARQYAIARRFAGAHLEAIGVPPPQSISVDHGDPGPALRIGYLSADFREHAVSHLLTGVLELHDRARFEIFGYSYGPDDGSDIRARVKRACTVFRDLSSTSDDEAARQIRADRIDILVDLTGWTEAGRPEILAYRPAPVQASWLGYSGTLGNSRLADYLIGDPIVTPREHADDYAETLALMPNSYQPNDRTRRIGPRPTRQAAGLPDHGFVFCSFNQAYKFNPDSFDIWCRLLVEIDGSVLWLLEVGEPAQANLRRWASERGVSPDRIIFAGRLPVESHLGRLQLADLALDTWPYNSHTTGADALWCGVPMITCMGDTFPSRVAASLVTAAGIPELIAGSPEHYYELALRLTLEPDALGLVREKLSVGRSNCALFDTPRFTSDLERLYRAMWDNHLDGDKRSIPSARRLASPWKTQDLSRPAKTPR